LRRSRYAITQEQHLLALTPHLIIRSSLSNTSQTCYKTAHEAITAALH